MKRVLIISYYFPPMGLGGTQRAAKFAKYLSEFGWEPTVITVKPVEYWAHDDSLLDDLHGINIIRTESWDPQRLLYKFKKKKPVTDSQSAKSGNNAVLQFINQKLLSFFLIPDTKVLWNRFVYKTVCKLLKENAFDAIMTTSPPHSSQLLGKKIKQKFGIKWIADFRDDWAGGVVVHEPVFFQKYINRRLEKSVILNADAVISVTSGMAAKIKNIKNDQLVIKLTNGFDSLDFVNTKTQHVNSKFTISHCGAISRFSNPETFFKALDVFIKSFPELSGDFQIKFFGLDSTGSISELINKYSLNEYVVYLGYIPHNQIINELYSTDALLLFAIGNNHDKFIPGKTFEYFGSQKPIFCISNVQDTSEIVKQYNRSIVVAPENPDKIADALMNFIKTDWSSVPINQNFIDQFNRRNQTRRLAEILDQL